MGGGGCGGETLALLYVLEIVERLQLFYMAGAWKAMKVRDKKIYRPVMMGECK